MSKGNGNAQRCAGLRPATCFRIPAHTLARDRVSGKGSATEPDGRRFWSLGEHWNASTNGRRRRQRCNDVCPKHYEAESRRAVVEPSIVAREQAW